MHEKVRLGSFASAGQSYNSIVSTLFRKSIMFSASPSSSFSNWLMSACVYTYIMGFCLINLQDPNVTFKSFIRLMDWYLKAIYENEFKLLKVYFVKFNKMLELYIPELADHFRVTKSLMNFLI